MKILIVEDCAIQRIEREHQLGDMDLEYTDCADAETALEAYRQICYPRIQTNRVSSIH